MKIKFAVMADWHDVPKLSELKKQLDHVKNIALINHKKSPPNWIPIEKIQEFSNVLPQVARSIKNGHDYTSYQLFAFSADAKPASLGLALGEHVAFYFEANEADINEFLDNEFQYRSIERSVKAVKNIDHHFEFMFDRLQLSKENVSTLEVARDEVAKQASKIDAVARTYLLEMENLLKSGWSK